MPKKVVSILGWIFIVIGILGFIPGVTSDDDMLLGIFAVDPVHNVIHLISGILAVWFAMRGEGQARMFAKVFGIIYLLVTILGFVGDGSVLGLFSANMADHILHLVFAVLFLWVGFAGKKTAAPAM